jgi:hypothetical protein
MAPREFRLIIDDKFRPWLPAAADLSRVSVTSIVVPEEMVDIFSQKYTYRSGGIYFYWQAGVVCYLNEKGYDLDQCRMSGASAGALTATLAATRVNFYEATDLALTLAAKAKVWDRGLGLQGIWGPLIEEWLLALLPDEEAGLMEYVDEGRLRLLVTPIPSFGKLAISKYEDKIDLIRCNMASIHLPWFLDGRLATHFRGVPMIDGSFRSQLGDYCLPSDHNAPIITLDWNQDKVVASKAGFLSFVQALSPEGIRDLLAQGKRFAQIMEEKATLKCYTQQRP